MILASAIRKVRGLGDNKFEVVTFLRTFVFRADREGTIENYSTPPPLPHRIFCTRQLLTLIFLLVSAPLSLSICPSSLVFLRSYSFCSPAFVFHALILYYITSLLLCRKHLKLQYSFCMTRVFIFKVGRRALKLFWSLGTVFT